MKRLLLLLLFISIASFGQSNNAEWNTTVGSSPIFPGCERFYKKETKNRKCFNKKIQEHIKNNFIYPEEAQSNGIEGRVFVGFIIEKDGSIESIRTKEGHEILQKEAKRICSLLPKMTPGTINGAIVRVPFSFPIYFHLN